MILVHIILGICLFRLSNCFVLNGRQEKPTACPAPYSSCSLGKDGFINVHLVPHTHDDVGWLKTVDQYYYGSNNDQQEASVQYILDTVVDQLLKDPSKRFVYVEIAFFWRWWNEQTNNTKQTVRMLVSQGRLEFVIGAWCMNDEATTYYRDIIDQQTVGLKFILKEFGKCARPRSAWQIDPFGHSREQASLFAQFGFDGLFLGRVDYQDFDNRGKTQTREMLWQASANLGKQAQLFTGVLPNGYNPPPGFCFDTYCGDDPIMDDPSLDEYNVDQKVNAFINYTMNQRSQYKTNNLIMTLGSDFQYSNAHLWFKNIDKLIYYVNKRQETNASRVNIFYSTTACYLYSLNKANETWSVKSDDFFPYAHRPHTFWTGYFTSRAALKLYVKSASSQLHAVRIADAFSSLNCPSRVKALRQLERALGVAQHHDAVSGTERQHVANDYAKRLSKGLNDALPLYHQSNSTNVKLHLCPLLNITECPTAENQHGFGVYLFNHLPRTIEKWVRVPVLDEGYTVLDNYRQQSAPSEIIRVKQETKNIPERNSKAEYELFFKANLPPLSTMLFIVTKTNSTKSKEPKKADPSPVLENEHLKLTFDSKGNLNQIDNHDTSLSSPLKQVFCYYKSMEGNNSDSQFQASGAYVFRPQDDESTCLNVRNYTVYIGEHFQEIHQVYNEWISQTVRLYGGARDVELEWQVGPIDVSDGVGKEVITKLSTGIDSKATFYTDSNGREILRRVRDFRPTWDLNQTEKTAGNYYPINSRIFIRDENGPNGGSNRPTQLTILTDRSQGGASIQDGSLEIMLHRRVLHDDSLGVSEPLNEKGSDNNGLVVKGTLNLVFNSTENSARIHRPMAVEINAQPVPLFVSLKETSQSDVMKNKRQGYLTEYQFPPNLNLLTLMKDLDDERNNSLIVRVEHFYENGEDPVLSQPAELDLKQFFSGTFTILNVEELALGANMKVEDLGQRLEWNAASLSKNNQNMSPPQLFADKELRFVFQPMQIRTFKVFVKPVAQQ